jgi:hypothetical protein
MRGGPCEHFDRLCFAYVAPGAGSIWTIEGSSFSSLLTRVEIGHMRIRSAGEIHLAFHRGGRKAINKMMRT